MRSIAVPVLALGLVVALPAFGSADEFTNGTSSKWGQKAAAGQAGQPAPNDTAQVPETLPEQGSSGSNEGTAKRGPTTPAAGYAYADKPAAAASRVRHTRYRSTGPVVNMPGFEQTADGGSRLFVQLSQSVPVEERKGQGSITYVLKGASPRVWNNTNALVTVHFNTPVSRARLVPHGQDVHFIVDLRSAATPTWKVNESQDKTATLSIEFPKGNYLQAGGAEPEAAQGESPAERSPPKARGGKRAPAKGAPAPAPAKPPANSPKP